MSQSVKEAVQSVQAVIEVDATGKKLAIDGSGGAISLAAVTAMFAMSLSDPEMPWPPVEAPPIAANALHPWKACLAPITAGNGPGAPPVAFLEELLCVIRALPDEVFSPNSIDDIYGKVIQPLGPWTGIPHRRAVMAEVLRVDGGFESNWNWNEGADTTAGPEKPDEEETGLWQVSANSMVFDKSLISCCIRNGATSMAPGFISTTKTNHAFAIEYTARLFRFNTRWSGPANRGWISSAVSRYAVAEWQQFLTA